MFKGKQGPSTLSVFILSNMAEVILFYLKLSFANLHIQMSFKPFKNFRISDSPIPPFLILFYINFSANPILFSLPYKSKALFFFDCCSPLGRVFRSTFGERNKKWMKKCTFKIIPVLELIPVWLMCCCRLTCMSSDTCLYFLFKCTVNMGC